MDPRRLIIPMRVSLSIALPAVRSCIAELKDGIQSRRICPFCDLPWLCLAAFAFLAKSCLLHRRQPSRRTFLDGDSSAACHCPHCVHTRHYQRAA
jgi:hypothetical protein